ncbi:deoxyribose-phosphate aldolase [Cryobacterium roopkundense]|uniref:Deoxyribose-phosphate aldolase n=1 Tax=Cryobacterium roopkundense TaxID=1001240 RepID=A0A099J8Q0_9MICO|nr:deoxyribose-phosphate aldolase [Cryobacterium roopkundense]KGJ74465.1 deoxyribose-phosphate aldolase [Cryobacterium roopkundense]MBB5643421.1 DhnA family fructose-bisphosphate aldolase class Ia [Cryobacterium roopkundense]
MNRLDFDALRQTRAQHPHRISEILASRTRRELIRGDGKLFIVAADHRARGALGVRNDQNAMANRYELLEGLATALSRPGVDGVLGTPDIIDDLALLGLLEDKIVVGSMNRGGLKGASFEMDDRYTAYSVDRIQRDRLDFAKNLLRINLADPGSVATLEATAQVVSEAAAAGLPIMLEPFMSSWVNGTVRNDLTTDAVILSIAIAEGLGDSSAYSWLKLPVVPEMDRVMAATTLPTLLLGGDPVGDQHETFESWHNALQLPGVRGLVVGRSLLYPLDGNIEKAIDLAATLVHGA